MEESRGKRWLKLLNITEEDLRNNILHKWNGQLTHSDQDKIRMDCESLYMKLAIFAEPELRDTLEWLITFYCKSHKIRYNRGLNQILAPFFLIGFESVGELYIAFTKFVDKFIPKLFTDDGYTLQVLYKTFHLLLLYHEPFLCNILDSKFLIPEKYAENWFSSLFGSELETSLLLAFWELCLFENNLTLPFFFGVVFLRRKKPEIFKSHLISENSKELYFNIVIKDMEDLESMCLEAKAVQDETPISLTTTMKNLLQGEEQKLEWFRVSNSIVMPISPSDLSPSEHIVIDTRPPESYERGHLPHSYNLSSTLNLSTEELWVIVSGFGEQHTSSVGGVCTFVVVGGEGRGYATTLALDLARRGVPRITLLGEYAFPSLHDAQSCRFCEINRSVRKLAALTSTSGRGVAILKTILFHWIQDECSSGITSPEVSRVHTPTPTPTPMAKNNSIEIEAQNGPSTNMIKKRQELSLGSSSTGQTHSHTQTVSAGGSVQSSIQNPILSPNTPKPLSKPKLGSHNNTNISSSSEFSPRLKLSDFVEKSERIETRCLPPKYNSPFGDKGRIINEKAENTSENKKTTKSRYNNSYSAPRLSMKETVRMLWTNRLEEGERELEKCKNRDPPSALHYAQAAFLRGILTGEKEALRVAFDRLLAAELLTNRIIKSYEGDGTWVLGGSRGAALLPNSQQDCETAKYYITSCQQFRLFLVILGEVLLVKAGCHITYANYIRASITFRKSMKLYLRAESLKVAQDKLQFAMFGDSPIESNREIEDDIESCTLFGKGTFHLALSMTPSSVIKLAKIIGLEGDQNKGLKYLYECINKGTGVRVPFALLFVIFWLLIYIPHFVPGKEGRHREARELLKYTSHYYSSSIIFTWLDSYLHLIQGELRLSLDLVNQAISKSGRIIPKRLSFEKGWCHFLMLNWGESISALELSLGESKREQPRAFTLLLLGVGNCMLGKLKAAQVWMEMVAQVGMLDKGKEKWILHRAHCYLTRKWFLLFPFEIIYLTDHMPWMKSKWHAKAIHLLETIHIPPPPLPKSRSLFSMFTESTSQPVDEFCILCLLKGCLLRVLGRLKEAADYLNQILLYEKGWLEDKSVIAHAYYELGMLQIKGRDWNSAIRYINLSKKIKNYDLRPTLFFKISTSLQLIQREIKAENEI